MKSYIIFFGVKPVENDNDSSEYAYAIKMGQRITPRFEGKASFIHSTDFICTTKEVDKLTFILSVFEDGKETIIQQWNGYKQNVLTGNFTLGNTDKALFTLFKRAPSQTAIQIDSFNI